METAVNYMTLFNFNSNLYSTSVIVLKLFGEKIAACADIGASHTIAGEKMFKFLQEHDVTFTNKRISFMMADGIRQTIMALSTVVDLCIEGKVVNIPLDLTLRTRINWSQKVSDKVPYRFVTTPPKRKRDLFEGLIRPENKLRNSYLCARVPKTLTANWILLKPSFRKEKDK
ncbi:hypothetical protein TNCV_2845991 [Trichonephila clavipes]|nr:hypothetical protein TNCV_2845991 [Trichonephila clavipes]